MRRRLHGSVSGKIVTIKFGDNTGITRYGGRTSTSTLSMQVGGG